MIKKHLIHIKTLKCWEKEPFCFLEKKCLSKCEMKHTRTALALKTAHNLELGVFLAPLISPHDLQPSI